MAKAEKAKDKSKKSAKSKTATYHNYIGGEWKKSAAGEWFENINPADTSDVVGRFPKSTAEDVSTAVEAAKNAATRPRRNALKFFFGWHGFSRKIKKNSHAK
jgi:aldehyde dehydrogenase (NAD+)